MQPPSMQVVFTVNSSKMQDAQELIEDAIVATVPVDQQPRMLYYLAKENEYGSSDGLARFQRNPRQNGEWVWMALVDAPPGFERCSGLFMDVRGRAVTDMIERTGVTFIQVSNTFPKYILAGGDDLERVDAATQLIENRIQWALEECKRRRR